MRWSYGIGTNHHRRLFLLDIGGLQMLWDQVLRLIAAGVATGNSNLYLLLLLHILGMGNAISLRVLGNDAAV